MQLRHEGIIRAINNSSKKYNILTFPTHERYQSNLGKLNHTFYLFQGKGIKPWNNDYAMLPDNHILLDGSESQIRMDMKFDMVLSQNKFGQFNVADSIARGLNIPLISIEHTLPVPGWGIKVKEAMKKMSGNINVFISEYSIDKWGFDINDTKTRVIHHGIDTEVFKPKLEGESFTVETEQRLSDRNVSSSVLSVVNDFINRDIFCGWNIYSRITNGLPIVPLGSTPGFSEAAKDINDLVAHYQKAAVFVNTSTVSPIPTSVLEAAACGCPIVTTATCMLPEIIKDGYNGFISNDEQYLREKLQWCLSKPKEARETIGKNARKTILDNFSIVDHLKKWNAVFDEVYGKTYDSI